MARLEVPVALRWSDLDPYGHVNNVALLTLLEEARVAAFWAGGPSPLPTAVLDAGPGATTSTVIVRQEVEYLRPLLYQRSPVVVRLWVGALAAASLDVYYEVVCADGRVVTRAVTTVALVDAATGSPRRLTSAEREAWAPYVDEPVAMRRHSR